MVSHNLPPAGGPIVAADFNQDGRPDLVLFSRSNPGGNPRVQFNRGGGVFEAGPVVPALHPVTAAGALDINGDGVTDLWLVEEPQGDPRQRALRCCCSGRVSLWNRTGWARGTLPPPRLRPGGYGS